MHDLEIIFIHIIADYIFLHLMIVAQATEIMHITLNLFTIHNMLYRKYLRTHFLIPLGCKTLRFIYNKLL